MNHPPIIFHQFQNFKTLPVVFTSAKSTLMPALEKCKEQNRKQIGLLSKQLNAHTRHLQSLQKNAPPKKEEIEGETAEAAEGDEEEEKEVGKF
jgi:hypothetical protein